MHVLGGRRAQSVRVHEAALPWASRCGGHLITRRCTGIWGSAAAEGPPSLAGAALGGPLVGPARGPSPTGAALRARGCLLCPGHVSARKLDWAFEVFLPAAFSYMSECQPQRSLLDLLGPPCFSEFSKQLRPRVGWRGCLEGQGSGTSCRPRTDSPVSSSPALILRMVMQRPVCDKDHILNSMQSLLC